MPVRQTVLLCALAATLLAAFPAVVHAQQTDAPRWDPTTLDPEMVDQENPPVLIPLTIPSGDAVLNAHLYAADGPGPHPTVIVLRDFPGWESNDDVAQALRRAGFNALMMGYRGAWNIHGEFSWENAVEDVAAAVGLLRSGSLSDEYRVDPTRIHLLGDGFGAWAGLMASMREPIQCVVAVAVWNAGLSGQQLASGAPGGPDWAERIRIAADPQTGPIRADAAELIAALGDRSGDYDLIRNASRAQVESAVLIASASLESDPAHSSTLIAAGLSASGARSTERYVLRDRADFSATRIRLARTVVGWFEERCPVY